jgi:hypothetical protein
MASKSLNLDTVVKILCHVYPLRAWCNARVVCSRPSARDARSMSRAMRPSQQTLLRTRYTLFCIFRWRRLPRSTALEVAGNNVSSRNVRAFARCGETTFFQVSPIQVHRLTHCRHFFSLPRAVRVWQRRSNNAYICSMISRNWRSGGKPRVMCTSRLRSLGFRRRLTNKNRSWNKPRIFS